MYFRTEKDLEDQICQYFLEKKINPINNRKVISFLRQPKLEGCGIPDLITYELDSDGNEFINVIELKNTGFKYCHLSQLSSYLSFVKSSVKLGEFFSVVNQDQLTNIFPEAIFDIFPNAKIEGSLVIVGEDQNFCPYEMGIDGLLYLTGITIHSIFIQNLKLVILPYSCGPCPSLLAAGQLALTALANGGELE